MYRSSSSSLFKRLFLLHSHRPPPPPPRRLAASIPSFFSSRYSSTTPTDPTTTNNNDNSTPPLGHQNATPLPPPPPIDPEALDSEPPRHGGHEYQTRAPRQRTVEYQEEQLRVLQAALPHVIRLGWSEAAMIAGAKEVGVSPSIIGAFPRKESALVEFFMDECLQKLIDRIDSGEDLTNLTPSERVAKLVKIRLEMQAPYITKWPQALSIQAQPLNIPTSFKQRALLVDEIWHASGDRASDIDWYMKRTVLGGIYSATEIYMLTDDSPDFRDTWAFLNNRVKDAFDMGKTVKEATHLAEAVGAGVGSTLKGFIKGMSRS